MIFPNNDFYHFFQLVKTGRNIHIFSIYYYSIKDERMENFMKQLSYLHN